MRDSEGYPDCFQVLRGGAEASRWHGGRSPGQDNPQEPNITPQYPCPLPQRPALPGLRQAAPPGTPRRKGQVHLRLLARDVCRGSWEGLNRICIAGEGR